jgi:hypothetical protein
MSLLTTGSPRQIDESVLREYFERLDPLVRSGTELFVIGGAAVALLGAKIRTTVDVDVAAPYSRVDLANFREASASAGLPVNPAAGYQGAYVEYVEPLMLTLPNPDTGGTSIVLFRGFNLTVRTGCPADLIASKLFRYSEKDVGDIRFLMESAKVSMTEIKDSVSRLPPRFRDDVLVGENLANLETDSSMWRLER